MLISSIGNISATRWKFFHYPLPGFDPSVEKRCLRLVTSVILGVFVFSSFYSSELRSENTVETELLRVNLIKGKKSI
jgi:hypothetical protein